MADEDSPSDLRKGGRRKDGRPYKEGNVREDGSYAIGRNRTAEHTRFAAGDGRSRGRRASGVKNLASDWAEELAETVSITVEGKKKKITKRRLVVKQTTARAIKGNDKATEIVMRHAVPPPSAPKGPALSDQQILELWLAQRSAPRLSDPLPNGPETPDAN